MTAQQNVCLCVMLIGAYMLDLLYTEIMTTMVPPIKLLTAAKINKTSCSRILPSLFWENSSQSGRQKKSQNFPNWSAHFTTAVPLSTSPSNSLQFGSLIPGSVMPLKDSCLIDSSSNCHSRTHRSSRTSLHSSPVGLTKIASRLLVLQGGMKYAHMNDISLFLHSDVVRPVLKDLSVSRNKLSFNPSISNIKGEKIELLKATGTSLTLALRALSYKKSLQI